MKKTTFLIVGKHAVLEALKNPSRKIERIFLTEDAQKKLNRENQSLNLFKKINVFYKSRKELDNLCGRDETAHQGLVAEVEQLEEITLKEFVIENKENNIQSNTGTKVTSPIIGTAYHAPEPGAKKFVEVGKKIKKGDTVMIVEAMKTMNHVPSTSDGVVKKVCVDDGQPVEFGQVIVILE